MTKTELRQILKDYNFDAELYDRLLNQVNSFLNEELTAEEEKEMFALIDSLASDEKEKLDTIELDQQIMAKHAAAIDELEEKEAADIAHVYEQGKMAVEQIIQEAN